MWINALNIRRVTMKKGFFILCLLAMGIYILSGYKDEKVTSSELKSKLLRYHVVANSDSEEDQRVKLLVKEAVLETLQGKLDKAQDATEAAGIVEDNEEIILATANKVLADEGADYTATMRVGTDYFPTKIYGDMTLPPGEYEALIIELGESEGKNWWCVLFPTLCFIEPTCGVLPQESKDKLAGVLTTEEYYAVIKDDDTTVKVESKLINWIKERTS